LPMNQDLTIQSISVLCSKKIMEKRLKNIVKIIKNNSIK